MLNKFVFTCSLLAAFPLLIQGQGEEADSVVIPDDCMKCLCQASSFCNSTKPCTTGSQYLCGPYLMGINYWSDAGQPTLLPGDDADAEGAFEACSQDQQCAERTVRMYMDKYAQDCNEDNVIDCDDFARIHVLGKSDNCFAPNNGTPFDIEFRKCRDMTQGTTNPFDKVIAVA